MITLEDIAMIGGGLLLLAIVSLLFTHREEVSQFIMASLPARPQNAGGTDSVYIPVNRTGMDSGMEDEDYEMPRVGRALSDPEIVILLASQKRAGKYRFSANDIYTLVKGDRNNVLRQVRELREGLPKAEFRTEPERDEWRAEMGLPTR